MKSIGFFVISFVLLVLAVSYQPLYALFPETLQPFYQLINQINTDILYIAGFLALMIAIFDGLPMLVSLPLFLVLTLASGYFLSEIDISIAIGKWQIL
mgnify:CR=1 FL=1